MSFAVVIVLHRSRPELATLLGTLPPNVELIVVDTGPDDGGAALAQQRGAIVRERRDNPGFGAACNEGLQHVREDVTVLLNPDTEPHDNALTTLAQRARDSPQALHAPRLLNADGSLQRSAHPLPGTIGAFVPALVPAPLLPAAIRTRAEPFRAHSPRTVGWAIAACLAARTDTFKPLGPFDPRIHLFAEDMDLCLRARARGIPTILHPDVRITHSGRHSIPAEPFELLAQTRREVVERNLGPRARRNDDAAQALTFATRIAIKRPNRRERAQLKAVLKRRDPGGPGSRENSVSCD